MKAILLSLALGSPFVQPVSDTVPTWDVEASCKGAVQADKDSNLDDVQTLSACMGDESQARSELVKSWASFPAALRTRCEGEAGGDGLASYVDLLVCLQIFNDPANQTAAAPTPASVTLKGAGKHRRKPPAK